MQKVLALKTQQPNRNYLSQIRRIKNVYYSTYFKEKLEWIVIFLPPLF